MSDIARKLINTPYGDPYWDMVGMMDGKKVVGHQMTDDEWKEYNTTIICFAPFIMDSKRKICWRYQGE